MYVPRAATERLAELGRWLRIVIVNGPRQSGKTTLLRAHQERNGGTYVTLDEAFQLDQARLDPVTFAEQGERPLLIDEVQRGGDALVRAVKMVVDGRQDRGQFILSGSSRFLTIPTLSESLAGRAAFVELWPLSMAERTFAVPNLIDVLFDDPVNLVGPKSSWKRDEYIPVMIQGGYPEALSIAAPTARRSWYEGYLNTVINRDISDFAGIQHAESIPRVLALVAARSGSPLVNADLASSLQLSSATVRNYLSYLEMVFLVTRVPSWSTNLTSKVTKTPKAFVTDSGLAAHLMRATPEALRQPGHPALGGLLETFVLSELVKLRTTSENDMTISHFRDRDGAEIDFVLERGDGRVVALEVKASVTPRSGDARHLRWLREKIGDRLIAGVVLHLGSAAGSLGDGILALPVSTLWDHRPLPGATADDEDA